MQKEILIIERVKAPAGIYLDSDEKTYAGAFFPKRRSQK